MASVLGRLDFTLTFGYKGVGGQPTPIINLDPLLIIFFYSRFLWKLATGDVLTPTSSLIPKIL